MKAKNKHFNIFKFSFCSFSFQALIIVIALHILADKSENKNIKYIWNFYLIISRSHLRTRHAYKKNGKRSDLAIRKFNIFYLVFQFATIIKQQQHPIRKMCQMQVIIILKSSCNSHATDTLVFMYAHILFVPNMSERIRKKKQFKLM